MPRLLKPYPKTWKSGNFQQQFYIFNRFSRFRASLCYSQSNLAPLLCARIEITLSTVEASWQSSAKEGQKVFFGWKDNGTDISRFEGDTLIDYLAKAQTMNERGYIAVLDKTKKTCNGSNISALPSWQCRYTSVSFFEKNRNELRFPVVRQPTYSPDLASSDFHLVPNWSCFSWEGILKQTRKLSEK